MKSKVYIAYASLPYVNMFRKAGWEMAASIQEADLVQFTGGTDISPELYGQARHSSTNVSLTRDFREKLVYNLARKANKPMAGICRGGQLLNVMCGGSLYQDVDNHFEAHDVFDISTGITYPTSSSHHQMMQVGDKGILLAYATESELRDICFVQGRTKTLQSDGCDPEVVFYPDEKCLCFQGHPEYNDYEHLADIYFGYIKHYLHLSQEKQQLLLPVPVRDEEKPSPIAESLKKLRADMEAQPVPKSPPVLKAGTHVFKEDLYQGESHRQAELLNKLDPTEEGVQVH